jgi:NAD(P)H-nitrite reductase large subunit
VRLAQRAPPADPGRDRHARDLSTEEIVERAPRRAEYCRGAANTHERTARFTERIGMETLRAELLSLLPYIPLEKVN